MICNLANNWTIPNIYIIFSIVVEDDDWRRLVITIKDPEESGFEMLEALGGQLLQRHIDHKRLQDVDLLKFAFSEDLEPLYEKYVKNENS